MKGNKKIASLLFWFWFMMVIVLSVIPKTPKSKITLWTLEFRLDYMEHLIVYLILGILFIINFISVSESGFMVKSSLLVLWIVFAVLTEVVQIYVDGRNFNPNDMYYNIAGVSAGFLSTILYFKRKQSSNNRQ